MPSGAIALAQAHELHLQAVAVGPVIGLQVLDALALMIEDDLRERDERRAGVETERFGNLGGRERGADGLCRAVDAYARALQQDQQRRGGEIGLGIGDADALGHVRDEIRERLAIDEAHAHRALAATARREVERIRDQRRGVDKRERRTRTPVRRPISIRSTSAFDRSATTGRVARRAATKVPAPGWRLIRPSRSS